MRYVWAILASIGILMIFTIIKIFYGIIIKNYREEHINELSKEVYLILGVSEIIPLVIAVVLIRIVWKKITSRTSKKHSKSEDSISLRTAVYNHTKDISSEIKPTVVKYKQNHQTSKSEATFQNDINEDEIYEKVMTEIEEDKRVKSTWAKALSQSDGDKNKAESIYINLRVEFLKKENSSKVEVKIDNLEDDFKEEKEFEPSDNFIKSKQEYIENYNSRVNKVNDNLDKNDEEYSISNQNKNIEYNGFLETYHVIPLFIISAPFIYAYFNIFGVLISFVFFLFIYFNLKKKKNKKI